MIHSNANLGVHGQGLLNLSGPGDWIEAQRLVLSLFYSIHVSHFSDISDNSAHAYSWSQTRVKEGRRAVLGPNSQRKTLLNLMNMDRRILVADLT